MCDGIDGSTNATICDGKPINTDSACVATSEALDKGDGSSPALIKDDSGPFEAGIMKMPLPFVWEDLLLCSSSLNGGFIKIYKINSNFYVCSHYHHQNMCLKIP